MSPASIILRLLVACVLNVIAVLLFVLGGMLGMDGTGRTCAAIGVAACAALCMPHGDDVAWLREALHKHNESNRSG